MFLTNFFSHNVQDKQNNSGGEFTLDIYVKEKNDNPHLMKVTYPPWCFPDQ